MITYRWYGHVEDSIGFLAEVGLLFTQKLVQLLEILHTHQHAYTVYMHASRCFCVKLRGDERVTSALSYWPLM